MPSIRSLSPSQDKIRQVAVLWLLALVGSALLVAAGRHWPEPPAPDATLALVLIVLPPLAMGWWVRRRWHLPGDQRGERLPEGSESLGSESSDQERH
jgi:hypothetical protein